MDVGEPQIPGPPLLLLRKKEYRIKENGLGHAYRKRGGGYIYIYIYIYIYKGFRPCRRPPFLILI